MKKLHTLLAVILVCALWAIPSCVQTNVGTGLPSAGLLSPVNLRCEYLVNPLGLDVDKPRLSWMSKSSRRGQKQTAYRVLVASSPEELARDRGDLWDSGKVASDRSALIPYEGRRLTSGMRC